MVLSGGEWNNADTITYTEDDVLYSLPVHVELPELGYYSVPETRPESYINCWGYIPFSGKVF